MPQYCTQPWLVIPTLVKRLEYVGQLALAQPVETGGERVKFGDHVLLFVLAQLST